MEWVKGMGQGEWVKGKDSALRSFGLPAPRRARLAARSARYVCGRFVLAVACAGQPPGSLCQSSISSQICWSSPPLRLSFWKSWSRSRDQLSFSAFGQLSSVRVGTGGFTQ